MRTTGNFLTSMVLLWLLAVPALAQGADAGSRRTLRDGQPSSRLQVVKRKPRRDKTRRHAPGVELDRQARRGKQASEARSRELLLREIRLLEKILRTMR